MKRLFRWLLCLFIVAVVLVVAGVLLLNTIVKVIIESRLRSETGMDVKIGKLDIGLASPTISIENFKMYNTAEFGGSPFLDIPEIYVDYDKDALRSGKLHLKLVRFNLAELDIVKNKKGQMNVQDFEAKSQALAGAAKPKSSRLEFTGIDTLNVTFQKLRVARLDAPGQEQEMNFGITNQVFHNIRTQGDLTGMAVILAARSQAAAPPGNAPVDMQKILQQLLH